MKWTLEDRGFLPNQDPLVHLSHGELRDIERLGNDLPRLVRERTFRSAYGDYLQQRVSWDDLLPALSDLEVERLFQLFSYFASAYVHAPGLPAVQRLPAHLAMPLVRLAQQVDRPPILAYASYCLHNWRRRNPSGPVALGNLELIQNFSTPGDGKRDEDWFILVHVDIEARAGAALNAVRQAQETIGRDDPEGMASLLAATQPAWGT